MPAQGDPFVGKSISAAVAATWTDTRRSLADLLDLHPDSLTRLLGAGLASAVLRWGGRGAEMTFSRPLALRWYGARKCRCARCRFVAEDCLATAEHLMQHRHGVLDPCPDESGYVQEGFAVGCDWPFECDLADVRVGVATTRAKGRPR